MALRIPFLLAHQVWSVVEPITEFLVEVTALCLVTKIFENQLSSSLPASLALPSFLPLFFLSLKSRCSLPLPKLSAYVIQFQCVILILQMKTFFSSLILRVRAQ